MSNKTQAICEMAKEKSKKRQEEVLSAIKKMEKSEEKITYYGVAKKTGASKSYLYGNEIISSTITKAREGSQKSKRSTESKDAIIKSLLVKIKQLEKEKADIIAGNEDSYKRKCERLQEENMELKSQLRAAYKY